MQGREYISELKRAGRAPYLPMKSWSVGGENVPADLFRDMQEVFPNANIMNVYGPTEVTAVTVHHPFPRGFDTVVIGRPDSNTHVYIVDAGMRPVPVGVPGELVLSGPRLALGYVGRPDLTAQAFIPNPCLDLVSQHINPALAPFYKLAYRTGDLVRWRGDGTIYFMGRIDRQVKITGVRIELGEVESALEGAEGVTGAVAAAVPDPSGQKRLVGYVTPEDVDSAAVLAHCRSLLVAAMVPSVVVTLPSFPLLPNGKVNQRALPMPDWSGTTTDEYVGPENNVEEAVQKVFATVLMRPVEEVSVMADFFGAGGTSLQVFRAVALLQEALGLGSVPATVVHNGRTARGVAGMLADMLGGAPTALVAPITAREWSDNMRPLSANQEQMWLLSTLAGSSAYNMPGAFELERVPNVAALRAAFDLVSARHEVLRTLFQRQKDGSVMGIVMPTDELHIPVEIFEGLTAEEEASKVAEEAAHVFNLGEDPLVHVRLIIRSAPRTGAVLALTMHHAVGDAWSLGVFWREVYEAYGLIIQDKTPQWPLMSIQYADYAAWQREQLTGDSGAALRQFWKDSLAGAPAVTQLPLDRPRPIHPTYVAGALKATLPNGLLFKLGQVARSLRVNEQAMLLAALQAVLLRYTGQDDLVIGVPVAGRDRQETHGLIGYFINSLPVRCLASDDASFADMVRGASAATLAALDHGLLPLEDVVAASGVARVANVNPLFQVLFQYMPSAPSGGQAFMGDIAVDSYEGPAGLAHAKMDLSFLMSGESILVDYMSELFDAATVERLFGSFVSILEQMVTDVNASALGGSLLSPQDADEVAALSMGEERPAYLSAPLVHEAFEAVAARSPDQRCLCFKDEWLTYGEVNSRASKVALHLASLGIGPGTVVGLMLDRSFELIVSILGVLKAGACYLPCDPAYPDDRIAIYLEDGVAEVVLVQAHHEARAQAMVGQGVKVIDVASLSGQPDGAVALRPASPNDAAYIIFTSGSTGRPKGGMVAHRGLKDLLPWLVDMYNLSKFH